MRGWQTLRAYQVVEEVTDLITHAMAPFKPGNIVVYVHESLSDETGFAIDVESLPGHTFQGGVGQWLRSNYHHDFPQWLGISAGQHFAGVRVPVENHIHLGEN